MREISRRFELLLFTDSCYLIEKQTFKCSPLSCFFMIGDMYEVGAESGRYYCLNVPLRDGIDDQSEWRVPF